MTTMTMTSTAAGIDRAVTATATATVTAPTPTPAPVPTPATEITPPRLFGPRGRHRRPRPRKVLLAAGGLALAAGALSLVRMTPETGLPGGLGAGPAEAEPRPDDPGADPDRATNAAATVGSVPKVSPSATSAMGGASATPTADPSLVPLPTATTVPPSAPAATTAPPAPPAFATTIPDTPNTPAPATTHPAPATSSPAPQPAPSQPTYSPAPQPDNQPGGVCVPVIGLCVGPLGGR